MSWLQRLSGRGRAETERADPPVPAARLTREGPDRSVTPAGRRPMVGGIFRRPSRGLAIEAPGRRKGPTAVELPYPAAAADVAEPTVERRAVPREPSPTPEPGTSRAPFEPDVQPPPTAAMAEGFAQPEVDLGLPPLRVLGVVAPEAPPAPDPAAAAPVEEPTGNQQRPPVTDEPLPPQPAPGPPGPPWSADPVSPVLGDQPPADPEPDLQLGGEPAEDAGLAWTGPPTAADPQSVPEPHVAPEPAFVSEFEIGPEPQIAHEPFAAQPVVELDAEPVTQETAPEAVERGFAEPVVVVDAPLDDAQPLHVGGLGERPQAVAPESDPAGEESAAPAVVAAANGGSEELAATLGGDSDDPNLRLAAAAGRPVVAMRRREEAIGSIVDCRVQPVGSLRVEPLALGPYRFQSAASADEFVDETMRALEYLGCDVG